MWPPGRPELKFNTGWSMSHCGLRRLPNSIWTVSYRNCSPAVLGSSFNFVHVYVRAHCMDPCAHLCTLLVAKRSLPDNTNFQLLGAFGSRLGVQSLHLKSALQLELGIECAPLIWAILTRVFQPPGSLGRDNVAERKGSFGSRWLQLCSAWKLPSIVNSQGRASWLQLLLPASWPQVEMGSIDITQG